MELPEQFKQFDYLIDIIRALIYPNYLKTKSERLRWYIHHMIDVKYSSIPPLSKIGLKHYLEQNLHRTNLYNEHYDISSCNLIVINPNNGKIDYQRELSEEEVFNILSKSDINQIEWVLKNTIFPDNDRFKQFIEADIPTVKYPLDKNYIFNMLPLRFINKYPAIFQYNGFIKYKDNEHIIIKNKSNSYLFEIDKNIFNMYFHFNDLINLSGNKNIDTIVTTFDFYKNSSQHFINCLIAGHYIIPPSYITEIDYEEFKQLMTYFQVILK